MTRALGVFVTAASVVLPVASWAQERGREDYWGFHSPWWPASALGASLFLLILLGWVLLHLTPLILGIVAVILGIRWLARNTGPSRPDAALAILRERYARGEITKEEFDAKLKDLGR